MGTNRLHALGTRVEGSQEKISFVVWYKNKIMKFKLKSPGIGKLKVRKYSLVLHSLLWTGLIFPLVDSI